jgi:hypothetical protein
MLEDLIRPRDRAARIPIPADDLAQVLTPRGWDCEVIDGWGELRIRVDNAELAFSGEDVGWQVIVEGDLSRDAAGTIVAAITKQIEQACGVQPGWRSPSLSRQRRPSVASASGWVTRRGDGAGVAIRPKSQPTSAVQGLGPG